MMGKLKNKQTEKLKQLVISEASRVFSFCSFSCSVLTLTCGHTETGRDQSPCTGLACSHLSAHAGSGQVGYSLLLSVTQHPVTSLGRTPSRQPKPGLPASHWAVPGVVAGPDSRVRAFPAGPLIWQKWSHSGRRPSASLGPRLRKQQTGESEPGPHPEPPA